MAKQTEKTNPVEVGPRLRWLKRHYRTVVAFAVGVVAVVLLTVFPQDLVVVNEKVDEVVATSTAEIVTHLERSSPQRLRIPVVGIDTYFEGPLGLNEKGEVEVPESYDEVGWYKYGPTPGELGPAVVLGHVDSYQGPAVFFGLGQLKPGDEIFIERADGKTVTFTVERLERHEQAGFPTAEVYSDIDYAGLRLITCTGVYSHTTLRYSHNLIVFARMKEE
jgi:hypothetical protein